MKILFLTHRVPFPPNRGDRIRAFHLLKFLQARGEVHLACLSEERLSATDEAALRSHCTQLAVVPVNRQTRWLHGGLSVLRGNSITAGLFYSRKLQTTLLRWASTTKFDVVVVFCSSMVQYLKTQGLQQAVRIVDLVDVDSEKWSQYARTARGPRRWVYHLEAGRLRHLEGSLPEQVHGITLVSEAEASLYRTRCPNDRTLAVTNGVDTEYFDPAGQHAAEREYRCVFLGALDYRPNVEGLEWFCEHVWPEVHRRNPKATLAVVGRRPVAAVRRLGKSPGIEVFGDVPDVRPHLAAAGVCIAPLKIARGIQNKVLESLAMAKATLATPQALEGLSLAPGYHVEEADTANEWIEALTRLCHDSDRRRQLGGQGRQFVVSHHSWNACLLPFEQCLAVGSGNPTGGETRSDSSTSRDRSTEIDTGSQQISTGT